MRRLLLSYSLFFTVTALFFVAGCGTVSPSNRSGPNAAGEGYTAGNYTSYVQGYQSYAAGQGYTAYLPGQGYVVYIPVDDSGNGNAGKSGSSSGSGNGYSNGNGYYRGNGAGYDPTMKKVAVLPFYNITEVMEAGDMVASIYVTEMFKDGRYRIEEPGNVRQFMIQERVQTVGEIEIDRLKLIGRRLDVDAVVVGTVEVFSRLEGVKPSVAITARMVDTKTGNLIWSEHNERKGEDYIIIFDLGELRAVTSLAHQVVAEMVETMIW